MATLAKIKATLVKFGKHYPRQLKAGDLAEIAEAWEMLCRNITDAQFAMACTEHLRTSAFFPTISEILACHEKLNPVKHPVADIPDKEISPDELLKNEISAAMCLLSLKNPAAKEFFNLTTWAEKEALARRMLGDDYPDNCKESNRHERHLQIGKGYRPLARGGRPL